jgi:uncharacterized membrane protein
MSTARVDLPPEPPEFRPEDRRHELARVLRRKRRLRAGTAQLLGVAAAVGLAFLTPHIHVGFDIPTTRAIEMLIAVGAGTVTFIGIVFSLLFLVVEFASTTFTPRLSLFRDDPIVWRAFAFYTSVVVYSFTAALVIGGDEKTSAAVPIVAFVAILAIIVLYRQLQTSAFKSIQLASALAQVARRGREVIDGLYTQTAPVSDPIDGLARATAPFGHDKPVHEIRWPRPAAVLQVIDVPRVLRAAEPALAVIDFKVGSGQMIAEGATLAVVSGQTGPELEREVLKALTIGEERTFEQDPAFALRLLADIGLRALSPAVNDPTTAVEALDAMDGLLRALATRELSVEQVAGRDGTIRVRLVLPTWDDYVAVTLDEIIALPALSPNVSRRILRLLDELAVITPPSRRSALEARRRQIHDPEGHRTANH